MDERIHRILTDCGAADARPLRYGDISADMSPASREKAEAAVPGLKGLIIAAFPYFAGQTEGNLALYARGEDYHRAVQRRLDAACGRLSELFPAHRFRAFVDISPIPEKLAARRAGLGIFGRNGLIFCPPYGSYVFLGAMLTDLPLAREGRESASCPDCGDCVRACPAGALKLEGDFGPVPERCLSGVCQRKGALTPEEERLLSAQPTVWGCDLCQNACPLNRDVKPSPLPDLTGRGDIPYLASLSPDDLEGLGNRAFLAKYEGRAFRWRGPEVLRRNLKLWKR